MLHVFEVYLAPGHSPSSLLTEEVARETGAQLMTLAEAEAVGFSGLKEPVDGRVLRLIAVAARDAQWIHRRLEANGGVVSYQVHEVG
ncbi:MAG: hypothetical protein JNK72_20400 [Myxococcales bacterium]|nr:hypothetical protein [Myxococcales bacterium]